MAPPLLGAGAELFAGVRARWRRRSSCGGTLNDGDVLKPEASRRRSPPTRHAGTHPVAILESCAGSPLLRRRIRAPQEERRTRVPRRTLLIDESKLLGLRAGEAPLPLDSMTPMSWTARECWHHRRTPAPTVGSSLPKRGMGSEQGGPDDRRDNMEHQGQDGARQDGEQEISTEVDDLDVDDAEGAQITGGIANSYLCVVSARSGPTG